MAYSARIWVCGTAGADSRTGVGVQSQIAGAAAEVVAVGLAVIHGKVEVIRIAEPLALSAALDLSLQGDRRKQHEQRRRNPFCRAEADALRSEHHIVNPLHITLPFRRPAYPDRRSDLPRQWIAHGAQRERAASNWLWAQ